MKHIIKFNENLSSGRFFFDQDQDCHWYMIPADLKSKWLEMTVNDLHDDKIDEFEHTFAQYRTGGGISHITFENPTE